MRLGIQHQRIHPGRPQQNGAHERMHRTLSARRSARLGGPVPRRRSPSMHSAQNTTRCAPMSG
ncbi:MAG: transposase [Acidobacteria bacterium]|nr:transposase [Acidobacteriota bacterium]